MTTKTVAGAAISRDEDEGRAEADEGRGAGASDSGRAFRYALFAYAAVEFVALALLVYYKVTR